MIKYFLYACLLATFLSICVECEKLESMKKKEAKYVKGHLQPLGESGDIVPVDVHSGFIKPELFYHEYVQKAIPVVFKGAAVDMPAYKLWTDEYIRSITPNDTRGNVKIEALVEVDGQVSKRMHMNEFLDNYKSEEYYSVGDLGDFMKKDMVLPWSIQCQHYESVLKEAILWFSNGGTKSKLHIDENENINCLFRGKKNFLIIDTHKYWPIHLDFLERSALFDVDADAVDLEKYPALRGIEFLLADIEAGDCIYIPIFILHYVKSFENNLAVNLFWQGSQLQPPIDTTKCSTSFDLTKTFDKLRINKFPILHGDDRGRSKLEMIAEINRLNFVRQFVEPPRHFFSYSQGEFVTKLLSIYGDHENFKKSFNLLFERIDTNNDGRFTELDRLNKNTWAANLTWVIFSESFDVLARRYGVNFSLSGKLVELPVADKDIVKILQASLDNVIEKFHPEKDEL